VNAESTSPGPKRLHPGRLEGKRVLLTGTAGGQGGAAQRLFAEHGAIVAGCDIQPGAAEASAKSLRDEGYQVTGADVDLNDYAAAREWVESSIEGLGGIDVLYNNAAGGAMAPFAEMTYEQWRHAIHSELDIIFHTTSPAWRYLCENGGSVINTASYSGMRGILSLGQTAHSAAKGGVIAMTRQLATEGAEHGVRVNAISPGFVKSPATDAFVDDAGREWQMKRHLIQRPGECIEIAYLALYLASDESAWTTGQNYAIDGGATAGYR